MKVVRARPSELQQAEAQVGFKRNKNDIEEEFGDVLFALVNYARYVDIDPETAQKSGFSRRPRG